MSPSLRNPISRLLIPRYNVNALYLMSLAFVLVFFSEGKLRAAISAIFFSRRFDGLKDVYHGLMCFIALGVFVAGILVSLFNGLTIRQIASWEKFPMLFFAVMVSGIAGIAAGLHMLDNSPGLLMVFPVWNIINGALLIILLRVNIIDTSIIVDEEVNHVQIIFGSIVVITAFFVCRFLLELYWAITFSICVAYATNVSETVHAVFFRSRKYDGN